MAYIFLSNSHANAKYVSDLNWLYHTMSVNAESAEKPNSVDHFYQSANLTL